MALCCIGGVCVPYTAVVPLLILVLQWVAAKLAAVGLLPKKIQELMQLPDPSAKKNEDCGSCCAVAPAPSGPSKVKNLESQEDFDKLIESGDQIVCKFTATWCKPCHRIQPVYDELSAGYKNNTHFLTIDVDDFDQISSQYKVAMMPTFLVLKGKDVKATYRGSDEAALRTFFKENVEM